MRCAMNLTGLLAVLSATSVVAEGAQSQGACLADHGDPFDPREATVSSVHDALFRGRATCREIVSSFIARIEKYNPYINAIISLNPNALSTAGEMDQSLKASKAQAVEKPLFCVPILLKDNYDTADMITTGGCADLNASQPRVDAITVTALRNAGGALAEQ